MGAKWNLATHARSEPLRRRQHHWSTQRRRDAPTTHQGAQLMLTEDFIPPLCLAAGLKRALRGRTRRKGVYRATPCRMRLLRAFRAPLLPDATPSRAAVPFACIDEPLRWLWV